MKQIGIFDERNRLKKLGALGDLLEKLNRGIDWHMFEGVLNRVFAKKQKGAGGRPPNSCLLLFKILILQRLFNIADDQAEYQINDRVSFMRFLGLTLGDQVPVAKTLWLFRDTMVKAGVMEELFNSFSLQLEQRRIILHKGTIIDATFVEAPRQRNMRDENRRTKEGKVLEEWEKPENVHKIRQKDTDAHWMVKDKEQHYGYKDHVKVGADSKLIAGYTVTDTSVYDSQALPGLIDEKDKVLYVDSAYSENPIVEQLLEATESQIHEKGYRNRPLNEDQKAENTRKSKIKSRIEHVFGCIAGTMRGITMRSIGIVRAKFNIGLTNLVCNLCRFEVLSRGLPVAG